MANKLNLINEQIEQLGNSERVTKALLALLSREILEYVIINDGVEGNNKGSEDSQVVNRLLNVLTPINLKVAIAFFQHHLAFNFDKDAMVFGKKDKGQWNRKYELVEKFLADKDNTIWTWADRNIDVAPKPMDFAKLNQAMGQLIKKAEKANLGHDNVVRAMLSNGITPQELLDVIQAAANEPEHKEEVQEQQAA